MNIFYYVEKKKQKYLNKTQNNKDKSRGGWRRMAEEAEKKTFRGVDMARERLQGSEMAGERLHGAEMAGARLQDSEMVMERLHGAEWQPERL
jgi:uncharacterized protein YjbI with pentapeptide repeats